MERNVSIVEECASVMDDVKHLSAAVLSADNLLDHDSKCLVQRSCSALKVLTEQMLDKTEAEEYYVRAFGEVWVSLGMLSIHLMSIFLPFDPAERQACLKNYCLQELSELERELSVLRWMQVVATGEALEDMSPSVRHPHVTNKLEKVGILKTRCVDLEKDQAYRPQPSQFNAFIIEARQFVASVASETTVSLLLEEINAALTDPRLVAKSMRCIDAWKKSVNAFISATMSRYSLYRDLWMPLLAGVTQVAIGIDILFVEVERCAALSMWELEAADLHQFLVSLSAFPASETGLQLAKNLLAPDTSERVQLTLRRGRSSSTNVSQLLDKLLLSGLEEIRNNVIIEEEINPETWYTLLHALRGFLSRWKRQEEVEQLRKAEKEAAYEFRAKTYCEEPSEDEMDTNYVRKMFPTYSEDFQDFETVDASGDHSSSPTENMELHTSDDEGEAVPMRTMRTVYSMHCQLMTLYTRAPWLTTTFKSIHTNYRRPFVARYQVAGQILKANPEVLSASLDHQLLGGHLVYSTLLKQVISSSSAQGADVKSIEAYDIYHDSNVAEVIQCRPVLESFSCRIAVLLMEWPDHPTLRQVQDVIVRVLGFPVIDPLMKFVTGLELLLSKAQEWEVNAHKGVSLMAEMEGVSQLIIKWRKMELRCWSSCLDSVVFLLESACAKWWFHVFATVETFLEDQNEGCEKMTDIAVITTIQQFLESSTLAEFGPRLQIIHSFHCHLVHMKPSVKQGILLKILWNAFQYYSQFRAAVACKIVELRKPIEKEVKGFVKIVRWNDVNFWTIKETVEKSHRTIAKHMKRFEKVLKQPVGPFLTDTKTEPAQAIKAKMQKSDFVIPRTLKCCIEASPLSATSSDIMTKLPRLFHRLRKLSRTVVDNSLCCQQTELVDNLTADIITTAHDLQGLVVNKGIPKPKQIAEAKSIHIRKRKALADLFKTLHSLGISYRKGLLMWNEKNWTQFMDLPMMDIEAALKQLKSLRADNYLAHSWQGCLHYLYRSVSRIALLKSSSQTPHKDLGLGNLHRLCGIPSHMMFLAQNHHNALSQVEQDYVKLRLIVSDVEKSIGDQSNEEWPLPQTAAQVNMCAAKSLHLQSQQIFEQWSVLLNCCPHQRTDILAAAAILPHEGASGLAMSQGDKEWQAAVALVQEAQVANSRCRLLLTELCPGLKQQVYVYSQNTVANLKKVFEELTSIAGLARQLAALFTTSSSSSDFVRSLCLFSDNTVSVLEKFREWTNTFETKNSSDEQSIAKEVKVCQALTVKLAQNILVTIQNVYKSRVDPVTTGAQMSAQADGGEDLMPNLFPELCLKFTAMAEQLKLKTISLLVTKTILQLQRVFSLGPRTCLKQQCCRSFKSVYPLLAQYLSLVQFCLTEGAALHRTLCKLMSVLLGIFNELVQKGFCVPDEYSEDVSEEGATEFQDIEGGGLGEGEGLKDVSDRIEDEDQLDGAQQEGVEKEEDDPSQRPDLKEEEHGIEMSEDFDGKSHDLDVETGSDSSNEEDNDDEEQLDKQMGDVEEGGEKLDEKVWGSDNEESDGEDDEDKSMEDGPGNVETSEPQMVAKDDKQNTEEADSKPRSDNEKDSRGNDPINELDEREYDDNEVDPYHDNKAPEEESAEPMEVSDELKLDSGEEEGGEEEDGEEQNDANKVDGDEEIKDDKDEDTPMEDEPTEEKEEELQQNEEREAEEMEEETETAKMGDDDSEQLEKDEGAPQESVPCTKPYDSQELAQPTESAAASEAATDASQPQPNTDAAEGKQCEQDAAPGMAQEDTAEQGQKGKASVQASLPYSSISERQAAQQQRPGQANTKRSLGDVEEKIQKRLRTVDNVEGDRLESDPQKEKLETQFADVHQHVEQPSINDIQTRDTATVEQAKEQPMADSETPADTEMDNNDIAMHDDLTKENEVNVQEKMASKVTTSNKLEDHQEEKMPSAIQETVTVEGEMVVTLTAGQSQESTFHTNLRTAMGVVDDDMPDIEIIRAQLERQLGQWSEWRNSTSADSLSALTAWHQFEIMTLPLAQELCEQLRLVLEPSLAAKLRGDYRTGKRLNMRKVIQYVASQFRKDKIWLRRTKPSKREYQVMLAMDDSSSMADNKVKELAFESLAVVSKALILLEVGELAVASFGESFRLLHPFHEPFTDASGAQILHQFTFEQKQTRVGQMLFDAVNVMKGSEKQVRGNMDAAQLLLIISDGRGLFVEGQEAVRQAVRKAQENHVFVVFIILDLPTNKHSIFDIRLPVYDKEGTGLSFVKSYMDEFPFPFYLVLRDIASLPTVLSDALRQWFELVSAAV